VFGFSIFILQGGLKWALLYGDNMRWPWDRFLIEGDTLYNVLTSRFNSFFDGTTIKHLTIIDGSRPYITDTIEMTDTMINDIEKELFPWIMNEYKEGRFFDKTLWRPFRNYVDVMTIYYAYRKLFKYNEYIFQVAIEEYCELDVCAYCNPTDDIIKWRRNQDSTHFSLALYGWREDNSNMVKPHNDIEIPEDDMIPDVIWDKNIRFCI
jgi:hypothetical protein